MTDTSTAAPADTGTAQGDTTTAAAEGQTLLTAAVTDTTPADAAAPAADAAPKDGAEGTGDEAKTETKPTERAAPEAYEFKAPEGVTLDKDAMGEFEAAARELNMPQAEAQALLERVAPKLAASMQTQQAQAVEAASAEWRASVEADPELGGTKLPETLASAGRFLENFGSPALRQLLNDSRLGNHPEVVRALAKAGAALGSDSRFVGGKAPGAPTSAQSIYAKSAMNP